MNFDYEIENEEGEVVATLSVDAIFSPYVPAKRSGHPDDWCPAEGGELKDVWVYLDGKDVNAEVDTFFGNGTYERICNKAYDLFDPYSREHQYDRFDAGGYDDAE
jgi:hypothetical protein